MVTVNFTPNLNRHLSCPQQEVFGETVSQALQMVFVDNPRLQSYILDDQGHLRKHVTVFVDGEIIQDRLNLSDLLHADSDIFIVQALSGG